MKTVSTVRWDNRPHYISKITILKRHDRVCAQLQFNICKEIGVKLDSEHCHKHVPKLAETRHEGNVPMLWNQQVQTDRTIPTNKSDIIIRDNEKRKKHVCRIDVAI